MRVSLLITVALSSLLLACTSEELISNQNKVRSTSLETIEGTNLVQSEVKVTFIGTIEKANDDYARVLVIEEPEGINLLLGNTITVDLSVNPDETFHVGDKIKVGYDGTIRETSPPQINTLTVEKVK